MALTKVSGDFIKAGSITQGHLHSSHGITTSHITEGDKLFFTNARVDSRIGSLSSSDLSEGTNLYYTDARARAAISATGSLSYNSTTGVMSFTMPAQNTSNITEGSNLYYTDARADARIAAADTGDLSEGTNLYYTDARADARITAASTSDLSEGTNLYYTDARADARITAADTDSLSEGSTNLYYTDARADARVALIVDSAPSTLDTLNELAAALGDDANFSTTVTNSIATKLPLAGGTLTGALIGTSFNDGYITWSAAQLNRYGAAIELQYTPTNTATLVKIGANGSNPTVFNAYTGDATFAGTITASGYNDSNWNTAYGWGDHASGGYAADSAVMKLTGNQTISGTKTFDNGSIVISGTHGTISFMDTTSGEDNFYLHTNSNNFYILADRDGTDAIDSGYDSPHPLQLEGDTNTAYVFGSALNIGNWNTAYGWGNHASAGYLTSFDITTQTDAKYIRSNADDTASGIITLTKNTATGLANSTFSHAKTIIGGIHFANGNGVSNNGNQAAITFQGSSASEAQAGIYVHNNNSEGTHMMFATTNSYATGPQAGITLLNSGNVTIRGTVAASNFSGSSSGANTGDQDLSGYATSATTLAGYGITNAIQKGAEIASGASWTTATRFGSTGDLSQAAGNHALSVRSENNNDAFMSFHIGSDYAVHFGLDGATNRMHVGGWSDGTGTQYQLYDSRDFSVASVLNSNVTLATLGYTGATNANYITNNNQLTNGAGYTTNTGTLTNSNDRNYLTDTRSAARDPSYYDDRYAQWDFSQSTNFGVSGGDSWAGILTVSKWSSWDASHRQEQLIFSGTKLARRVATSDTAWSSTYDIIDTSGVDNVKAGYIQSSASLRAPLFYDSGNTNYFVDPGGNTSRIQGFVKIGNSSTYNTDDGSWGTRLVVASTIHARIDVAQDANAMRSSWFCHTGNTGSLFGTVTAHDQWLYSHNAKRQTLFNGYSQEEASYRAPIFYDSNDTGYYVDPASKSFLSTIHFNGSVSGTGAGSEIGRNHAYDTMELKGYGAELMIGAQHPEININYRTCNGGVSGHTPTTWKWRAGTSSNWSDHYMGLIQSSSSMRAPIFYDSNNTGYYVDPASASSLVDIALKGKIQFPSSGLGTHSRGSQSYAIYQESGSWTSPFPDLNIGFHTGISMGAYSGYNGMRFYNNSDMATQVMSINNGSDGLGGNHVYVNNSLQAGSSLRAPIFYDSNDTNYYADPASTSDLKLLRTGKNHQVNAVRWDTSFYVAQSQHYYGHNSTQAMYLGESNTINIRSIGIASGSLRAPIFYDSNNTAYYVHADSTSNMNAVTLVGTLSGQNAYFNQSVGIGFTSGNIGGRLNVKNSAAGQIATKLQLGASVNSASTGVFINTTASYASSGMFLHFQSNHISGDDNVLIAYLDGDIVNKNNSYTQYSDQRLKENIVDATSKLDEIKQIRVRNFNFIGEDLKQIGVVAQELEPIFPGLVKEREVPGHEDPIKTVKYSVLVPILIKAMQEQQTIIDDLKSRLETLENQ